MFEETIESLMSIQVSKVHEAVGIIIDKINQEKSLWLIGNGGSCAASEHLETDLSYIREESNKVIKAHALASNSSLYTALVNDIEQDLTFARLLARKALPGDACVLISTSGNSRNIINAIKMARKSNVFTIGIFGSWNGQANMLVDLLVEIGGKMGDYASIENAQLAVCHEISKLVRNQLFTN